MNCFIYTVLVLAAPPADSKAPAPQWEATQSDGITIMTREVPGSSIREVKAVTVLNVDAKNIWVALEDLAHYTEFMPYVTEARALSERKDDSWYEYQILDAPIVDTRDYALKMHIETDTANGYYQRTWKCVGDKGPPIPKGTIRVTKCNGSWTLNEHGPKKTHIVYYLYTDPGGAIPAWIANKANTTNLPELFDAIKNRALDPKWKWD